MISLSGAVEQQWDMWGEKARQWLVQLKQEKSKLGLGCEVAEAVMAELEHVLG